MISLATRKDLRVVLLGEGEVVLEARVVEEGAATVKGCCGASDLVPADSTVRRDRSLIIPQVPYMGRPNRVGPRNILNRKVVERQKRLKGSEERDVVPVAAERLELVQCGRDAVRIHFIDEHVDSKVVRRECSILQGVCAPAHLEQAPGVLPVEEDLPIARS